MDRSEAVFLRAAESPAGRKPRNGNDLEPAEIDNSRTEGAAALPGAAENIGASPAEARQAVARPSNSPAKARSPVKRAGGRPTAEKPFLVQVNALQASPGLRRRWLQALASLAAAVILAELQAERGGPVCLESPELKQAPASRRAPGSRISHDSAGRVPA